MVYEHCATAYRDRRAVVEGRNNIHVQMMRARNSRIEGEAPLCSGFNPEFFLGFQWYWPTDSAKNYGDCPHQSHRFFLNSPKLMNDDENESDDLTRN